MGFLKLDARQVKNSVEDPLNDPPLVCIRSDFNEIVYKSSHLTSENLSSHLNESTSTTEADQDPTISKSAPTNQTHLLGESTKSNFECNFSLSFCKCKVYVVLGKEIQTMPQRCSTCFFQDSLFSICIIIHVPTVYLTVLQKLLSTIAQAIY